MRIYLVRHPRPAVAAGICYGRTDLPLADDPATCAARLLSQLPPGLPVFSSPLQRCRALAEQLHPAPIFDARLMEMDFGRWEMQSWDTLDRAALDDWAARPLDFVPPGGESAATLRARVHSFLHTLTSDAILVTHAGVIKLVSAILQDLPEAEWLGMRFAYGSLTTLCCDDFLAAHSSCAAPNSAVRGKGQSQ